MRSISKVKGDATVSLALLVIAQRDTELSNSRANFTAEFTHTIQRHSFFTNWTYRYSHDLTKRVFHLRSCHRLPGPWSCSNRASCGGLGSPSTLVRRWVVTLAPTGTGLVSTGVSGILTKKKQEANGLYSMLAKEY